MHRPRCLDGGHRLEAEAGEQRLPGVVEVELSHALVATGFGYKQSRRQAQAEVVHKLLPEIRDLRRVGSAALDMCMVAAGYVNAYFERGAHAWDVMAGTLIATEAGAVVSGLRGNGPTAEMVVAAAPATSMLPERIAAFPQLCLRNDRLSAIAQWSLDWDEAQAFEIRVGMETLRSGSSRDGAARFAAGQGRGGAF